ncbi:hypothetical protein A2U01_0050051, partial [Trifolium medium]|nr:hypothetical protein [Trifolium medium]
MRFLSSKSLKYLTHPLLEGKPRPPVSDNVPFLFSNEPPDVIFEFMRLMKDEVVIITGDNIAKVSPGKRKRIVKVKQELAAEEKTSGNTSASGAGVPEA